MSREREPKTLLEALAEVDAAALACGRAMRQQHPVKWIIDMMERFVDWLARKMAR